MYDLPLPIAGTTTTRHRSTSSFYSNTSTALYFSLDRKITLELINPAIFHTLIHHYRAEESWIALGEERTVNHSEQGE